MKLLPITILLAIVIGIIWLFLTVTVPNNRSASESACEVTTRNSQCK